MKRLLTTLILVLFTCFCYSQQLTTAPNGFKKGSITYFDGTTMAGFIKSSSLKTGKLIFLTAENKKTTYEASLLKDCTLDSNKYLSYKNDFYLKIVQGEKLSFYQKQSSIDGTIRYNGTDPIVLTGGDGSIGDYFLSGDAGLSMQLITKRNFADGIKTNCPNCVALLTDINSGKLTFADIKQIVLTCNNCN